MKFDPRITWANSRLFTQDFAAMSRFINNNNNNNNNNNKLYLSIFKKIYTMDLHRLK